MIAAKIGWLVTSQLIISCTLPNIIKNCKTSFICLEILDVRCTCDELSSLNLSSTSRTIAFMKGLVREPHAKLTLQAPFLVYLAEGNGERKRPEQADVRMGAFAGWPFCDWYYETLSPQLKTVWWWVTTHVLCSILPFRSWAEASFSLLQPFTEDTYIVFAHLPVSHLQVKHPAFFKFSRPSPINYYQL